MKWLRNFAGDVALFALVVFVCGPVMSTGRLLIVAALGVIISVASHNKGLDAGAEIVHSVWGYRDRAKRGPSQ